MKRIRFTEEQIIGVLREAEAGAKTADIIHLLLSSQRLVAGIARFFISTSRNIRYRPEISARQDKATQPEP